MQIVLNTHGIHLSQRNKCFLIGKGSNLRIISPARVTSILITKSARVSSNAMTLAADNSIPIVILNGWGAPTAKVVAGKQKGHPSLRRKQYQFVESPAALDWAMNQIRLKISGQLRNLSFFLNRKPGLALFLGKSILDLKALLNNPPTLNQNTERNKQAVLVWEAGAGRIYWNAIGCILKDADWLFEGRDYPKAYDKVNNAINYLYGLLYNQVETAVYSVGLDSQVACLHADQQQAPSLAFDLIEPFRPYAERMLFYNMLRNNIIHSHFDLLEQGWRLNRTGRMVIIQLFYQLMEFRFKKEGVITELKRHILSTAFALAGQIRSYVPEN